MSSTKTLEERYAKGLAKSLGTTQRRVLGLFRTALNEAVLLSQQVDFDPSKPFTFDDYPLTKRRSDRIISDLQERLLESVATSVQYAWGLAEDKNDELARRVLGSAAVPKRRSEGVEAFVARKEQGLSLSDRVWRYANQFKEEIEMSLDLGLRDGLDAPAMSRSVREYLVEPNKLFRRVRDVHGRLHLSSRAEAYHPGQGVYRSSYKNALRLTATETNIAYRTADYERIQGLDFVRGIEVCLSQNHTLNGKPFHCICDEFAGRYPKDFKFVGWHPLCRCYVKTILADDPFSPEDSPEVEDLPDGIKGWVADNGERIDRAFAKGKPAYWLRDNAAALRLHRPSKSPSSTLQGKRKGRGRSLERKEDGRRTPEQAEDIRRRWRERAEDREGAFQVAFSTARAWGVKSIEVKPLARALSEDSIIERLGGGDKTKGSCSSLALAYAGNKAGLDVLDFRGGKSQTFFSNMLIITDFVRRSGGVIESHTNDFVSVGKIIKHVKEGREYYFSAGKHAAIITKRDGKLMYLELQSAKSNGFKPLTRSSLILRFSLQKSHTYMGRKFEVDTTLVDIQALAEDPSFKRILSYLNTNASAQEKGASGGLK